MANEILTNFVGLVSQLPDLDEFPEESRENYNKVGVQTKVDIELVQIFEQYFLATIDEVDRFKKINDPLVIHADDTSEEEDDDTEKPNTNPDTDGSGQGSSKQADIADAAAAAAEKQKKKKTKITKNRAPNKNKNEKFKNPILTLDNNQKSRLGCFLLENLPNEFIYSILKVYSDSIMDARKDREARMARVREREERKKARTREKKEQRQMAAENLGIEVGDKKSKKNSGSKVDPKKELQNAMEIKQEIINEANKSQPNSATPNDEEPVQKFPTIAQAAAGHNMDSLLQPEIQRGDDPNEMKMSDNETETFELPGQTTPQQTTTAAQEPLPIDPLPEITPTLPEPTLNLSDIDATIETLNSEIENSSQQEQISTDKTNTTDQNTTQNTTITDTENPSGTDNNASETDFDDKFGLNDTEDTLDPTDKELGGLTSGVTDTEVGLLEDAHGIKKVKTARRLKTTAKRSAKRKSSKKASSTGAKRSKKSTNIKQSMSDFDTDATTDYTSAGETTEGEDYGTTKRGTKRRRAAAVKKKKSYVISDDDDFSDDFDDIDRDKDVVMDISEDDDSDNDFAAGGVDDLADLLGTSIGKTKPKPVKKKTPARPKRSKTPAKKAPQKINKNKQAEEDLIVKVRWNLQPQNFLHGQAFSLQATKKQYFINWFGDPDYDPTCYKPREDAYGALIMIRKKMATRLREKKRREQNEDKNGTNPINIYCFGGSFCFNHKKRSNSFKLTSSHQKTPLPSLSNLRPTLPNRLPHETPHRSLPRQRQKIQMQLQRMRIPFRLGQMHEKPHHENPRHHQNL